MMFTKFIFSRVIIFIVINIIFETMARVEPVPISPKQQVLWYRNVKDFVSLSPCPLIFQYKNERYGIISVSSEVYNSFNTARIQVEVFIRVRGLILNSKNTGKLELLHDAATTNAMIKMQQPIQYRIEFPRHPTTPTIVNITVNGHWICKNDRPLNMNERSSIIRLKYGLSFPQLPQIVSPFQTAEVDSADETTEYEMPWDDEVHSSTKLPKPVCGKIANKFRLTHLTANEEDTARGTSPWLVAIFVKTVGGGLTFKCSGNLLSNRIVVSAAHCFMQNRRRIPASEFVLSFGRHNLRDWSENVWDIERIEIPRDYLRKGAWHKSDSDIAILIMQEFVQYSELIQPICLWSSANIRDSEISTGIIVGWGSPSDEVEINVPRKMEMKIVAKDLCLLPSSSSPISKRIICAESVTEDGPCRGDSGNGLAIWQNGAWFLRGIVSAAIDDPYLNRCGQNEYVILTDISKFSAWIHEWINKFQYMG